MLTSSGIQTPRFSRRTSNVLTFSCWFWVLSLRVQLNEFQLFFLPHLLLTLDVGCADARAHARCCRQKLAFRKHSVTRLSRVNLIGCEGSTSC